MWSQLTGSQSQSQSQADPDYVSSSEGSAYEARDIESDGNVSSSEAPAARRRKRARGGGAATSARAKGAKKKSGGGSWKGPAWINTTERTNVLATRSTVPCRCYGVRKADKLNLTVQATLLHELLQMRAWPEARELTASLIRMIEPLRHLSSRFCPECMQLCTTCRTRFKCSGELPTQLCDECLRSIAMVTPSVIYELWDGAAPPDDAAYAWAPPTAADIAKLSKTRLLALAKSRGIGSRPNYKTGITKQSHAAYVCARLAAAPPRRTGALLPHKWRPHLHHFDERPRLAYKGRSARTGGMLAPRQVRCDFPWRAALAVLQHDEERTRGQQPTRSARPAAASAFASAAPASAAAAAAPSCGDAQAADVNADRLLRSLQNVDFVHAEAFALERSERWLRRGTDARGTVEERLERAREASIQLDQLLEMVSLGSAARGHLLGRRGIVRLTMWQLRADRVAARVAAARAAVESSAGAGGASDASDEGGDAASARRARRGGGIAGISGQRLDADRLAAMEDRAVALDCLNRALVELLGTPRFAHRSGHRTASVASVRKKRRSSARRSKSASRKGSRSGSKSGSRVGSDVSSSENESDDVGDDESDSSADDGGVHGAALASALGWLPVVCVEAEEYLHAYVQACESNAGTAEMRPVARDRLQRKDLAACNAVLCHVCAPAMESSPRHATPNAVPVFCIELLAALWERHAGLEVLRKVHSPNRSTWRWPAQLPRGAGVALSECYGALLRRDPRSDRAIDGLLALCARTPRVAAEAIANWLEARAADAGCAEGPGAEERWHHLAQLLKPPRDRGGARVSAQDLTAFGRARAWWGGCFFTLPPRGGARELSAKATVAAIVLGADAPYVAAARALAGRAASDAPAGTDGSNTP